MKNGARLQRSTSNLAYTFAFLGQGLEGIHGAVLEKRRGARVSQSSQKELVDL